jgi:hypothetical protein
LNVRRPKCPRTAFRFNFACDAPTAARIHAVAVEVGD